MLQQTNNAPELITALPPIHGNVGSQTTFDVSGNYWDDDLWDVLSYTVRGSGGAALPPGLSIDSTTGLITFKPSVAWIGISEVQVTATDLSGASVTDNVSVSVDTSMPGLYLTKLYAKITDYAPTPTGGGAVPSFSALVGTQVTAGRLDADFSSNGYGAELSRGNFLQLFDAPEPASATGNAPYVSLPMVSTLVENTSILGSLRLKFDGQIALSIDLGVRMDTDSLGVTRILVEGDQSIGDLISFPDDMVLAQTGGSATNPSLDLNLLRLLEQNLTVGQSNALQNFFPNHLDMTFSVSFTGLPIFLPNGDPLLGLDASVSIDDEPNRAPTITMPHSGKLAVSFPPGVSVGLGELLADLGGNEAGGLFTKSIADPNNSGDIHFLIGRPISGDLAWTGDPDIIEFPVPSATPSGDFQLFGGQVLLDVPLTGINSLEYRPGPAHAGPAELSVWVADNHEAMSLRAPIVLTVAAGSIPQVMGNIGNGPTLIQNLSLVAPEQSARVLEVPANGQLLKGPIGENGEGIGLDPIEPGDTILPSDLIWFDPVNKMILGTPETPGYWGPPMWIPEMGITLPTTWIPGTPATPGTPALDNLVLLQNSASGVSITEVDFFLPTISLTVVGEGTDTSADDGVIVKSADTSWILAWYARFVDPSDQVGEPVLLEGLPESSIANGELVPMTDLIDSIASVDQGIRGGKELFGLQVRAHSENLGDTFSEEVSLPPFSIEPTDVTLTLDNDGTPSPRDDGIVVAGNGPAQLQWNALYPDMDGRPYVAQQLYDLPGSLTSSLEDEFISLLDLRESAGAGAIGVKVTAMGSDGVDTARFLFNPVVDLSAKIEDDDFNDFLQLNGTGPYITLDLTGLPIVGTVDMAFGTIDLMDPEDQHILRTVELDPNTFFDHFILDAGTRFIGADRISEVVTVTAGGNYLSLGTRDTDDDVAETDVVDYGTSDQGINVDLSWFNDFDVETDDDAANRESPVLFWDNAEQVWDNSDHDVLVGVEGVFGSQSSDYITGDYSANLLAGNGGDDDLDGRGGDDLIFGGSGRDTLWGSLGDDILVDLAGEDNRLIGDTGYYEHENDLFVTGDGDANLGPDDDHATGTVVADFDNSDEFARLPGRGALVNDSVGFRVDLEQAGLLGLGNEDYTYDWDGYLRDQIFPNLRLVINVDESNSDNRLLSLVWDPDGQSEPPLTLADIMLEDAGANLEKGTDLYGNPVLTHTLHAFFLHGDMNSNFDEKILQQMFGFDTEANALFVRATIEEQRLGTLLDSNGDDVVIGGYNPNVLTPGEGNDRLSGGRGPDSYEYHVRQIDVAGPREGFFGDDVIIDWGDRSATDADTLWLEGVNSVNDLTFDRTTYRREGPEGSLIIDVEQTIYDSMDAGNPSSLDELSNHGSILLFNQYSRSQSGYRIENLVLVDEDGGEVVYDLGRVEPDRAQEVWGWDSDLEEDVLVFGGGGDVLTMAGVNDAILFGSTLPDEFQIDHDGSTGILTVHLYEADLDDRITFQDIELAEFLEDADYQSVYAGAPPIFDVDNDTWVFPSPRIGYKITVDDDPDTILKLIFHGGDWLPPADLDPVFQSS